MLYTGNFCVAKFLQKMQLKKMFWGATWTGRKLCHGNTFTTKPGYAKFVEISWYTVHKKVKSMQTAKVFVHADIGD